jgi:hypothetical protein
MDQVAKQSTIDRLAQANNVLVTVSASPSVDQLAAAIALTLFLNKQGKHATAVFSGDVPSTIEFLQPDKTLEKNTDSLRDFIISLDKAKADKLRYKVEDNVVRIFITPYRTSITEKDFNFSQGDFNVDVVIALGVHSKEELDQAIVAHGRILHDATVISINNAVGGNLGTINWHDQQASSLCEMLVELAEVIKADSFDGQMSTAFLTGIVAETQRFSNAKTTSRTMSLAAKLMAAGANQQLVATQLQSKSSISTTKAVKEEADADGTLEISHESEKPKEDILPELPEIPQPRHARIEPLSPPAFKSPIGNVRSEGHTTTPSDLLTATPSFQGPALNPAFPAQPPTRGGTLTANTRPEDLSPSVDPLGLTREQPLMQRGQIGSGADNDLGDKTIAKIEDAVIDQDKTLSDIEKTVDSPHVIPDLNSTETDTMPNPAAGLGSARDAVAAAEALSEQRLTPMASIGASAPFSVNDSPSMPPPPPMPASSSIPPQSPIPTDPGLPPEQTGVSTPASAPPPVPPPMTAAFPPQGPPTQ